MVENAEQPREQDAVLGGQTLQPISGAILGGLEGLKQRLSLSDSEQRIATLSDAANYGDEGIELLINAWRSDEALVVRAAAYTLLKDLRFSSEKVGKAIVDEILLNPGDRIYSVYESAIAYNDCWYYLLDSLDQWTADYELPKLVSRHVFKGSAEAAAIAHHQWRSLQENISSIGHNNGFRGFDLILWCRENHVPVRLPGEKRWEFEQRVSAAEYMHNQETAKLWEEHHYVWEEWQRDDFAVDDDWWEMREEMEQRIVTSLQESQNYELLGKLWLKCAGKLAFVHEETVTRTTYLLVTGTL